MYGLSLLVLGALVSMYALVRLGAGRHGRAWYDVSYLANPMSAAHVENLACLVVGGACALAGAWLVIRAIVNRSLPY